MQLFVHEIVFFSSMPYAYSYTRHRAIVLSGMG
jgi:hypothetical protein